MKLTVYVRDWCGLQANAGPYADPQEVVCVECAAVARGELTAILGRLYAERRDAAVHQSDKER